MSKIVNDEESLAQKSAGKLHFSKNTRLFREHLKKIKIVSTVTVIIVAAVLIVSSVIFAADVSTDMDDYIEDEAQSVMSNFAEHIGEDVSTNLNMWYSHLDMACETVSSLSYSSDDISSFDSELQALADAVKFEKFGLVVNEEYDGCEGMLYISGGEKYGVSVALDSLSDGKNYIGELKIDGERKILLAVPYDGEDGSGKLKGVAGLLDPDDFAAFLKTSVFSEQSYIVIVDSGGDVVAVGDVGERTYSDNFIADLETMDIGFDTLATISAAIAGGTSGIINYTFEDVGYFMYYTAISESLTQSLPLPVASWRIVMMVEVSAISQGIVNEFNNIKILFASIMVIMIVVFLVFVISLSGSYARNLLLRYTDPVTGSINQQRFAIDAQSLLDSGKHRYVLVSLNIRHFKLINEEYGREKADALLAEILKFIEGNLGGDELVARGYADRYLVLIACDDGNAAERLEKLYDGLTSARFTSCADEGVKLKFIMGAYIFAEGEKASITEATDSARLARVQGLNNVGGRAITYFSEDMLNAEKQESAIEKKAERALENGDFVVYYQLKCNIQSGKWCGAEALVRWKDPEQGMISPGKFIPLFERNGMIVDLDKYVFERVCSDMRASLDGGKIVVPVSVNLSREHFMHENFFDEYEQILEKYGVPHKYIEFEITESLAMEHEEDLKKLIARIHEIGCRCSVDDFGSGYSSLNMLHDYDFDVIKLDGKFFMSESGFGADSKKIVSSLIRLFHDLDKEVVAEGVENKETVEILKQDGCDTVQGFYFARPVPFDEYEQKLLKKPLED